MSDDGGAGFPGRRILITGGGTGIGATTAKLLAARGARVAILDRDAESQRKRQPVSSVTIRVSAGVATSLILMPSMPFSTP